MSTYNVTIVDFNDQRHRKARMELRYHRENPVFWENVKKEIEDELTMFLNIIIIFVI